jgi:hypothetical protein
MQLNSDIILNYLVTLLKFYFRAKFINFPMDKVTNISLFNCMIAFFETDLYILFDFDEILCISLLFLHYWPKLLQILLVLGYV